MATPAQRVLKTAVGEDITTGMIRSLEAAENGVLAVVFTAAIMLPLLEIVLRGLFSTGIEGVSTLVRHLTLAVGMLGAAVAAREQRLLTLAVSPLLTGSFAGPARLISGSLAAAICVLLAMAALEFVAVEREAGNTLVYSLPAWTALLPLPLGFGLIALRLVWHTAKSPLARATAA